MENNKKVKNNKRKITIIISFIIMLIIILLGLFGCKRCNDNKNKKILNSLPKIDNKGYWIDKDDNKLTDNKSNYNNINAYEYYKEKDKSYNKSVSEFIKDYNSKNLKKFKVEFFNKDDSLYDSKEYNFLDNLKFPQDPILVGIRFKGWKLLNNDINKDILFTSNNKIIVDDNFKFKAIYIQGELPYKETYKVEFIVDKKTYKEFEVKKGNIIKEFEAPKKDGYLFLGWYDQYDNKFDFNSSINQDLTIKAKYFSLNSYNNSVKKHDVNYLDEDGNIYQTIEVENFGKAHNIIGKAKVGYHFVRWLDNESLLPFDFDTQIIKPTTLKPEYEINKYLVQFSGADINNLPDSFIDVPHGTILVEPDVSAMNKVGYHFMNKYLDQHSNEFIFGTTQVTENLTLTPVFEINRYTVSFDTTQGINNLPSDITNIAHGSTIAEPTHAMSKTGYHFINKYLDQDGNEFKFGVTPVTKDLTLTPVFEINRYTVSYDNTQGINNLPSDITNIAHGSTILEPTHTMSKVGYHFMNKYLDQHGDEFIFGTTQVNENLVLTPVFEINKYKITFKANPDFDNIPDEITGVEHGSKVSKPAGYNLQCNVDGYELDGLYYTDSNGVEQEFKFNDTVVESDIEITIKKKIKRHRVTIEDHLGNQVSSAEYDHFTELTLPKFTTDYVYEYFYNGANSSEHYNEDKDANNFKYEVTKNITLKPKAHKKHIKFSLTDNDINVLQGGTLIPTKTIYVVTGKPITLPTAKKDNYYRLKPIVWQYKDNGGVYHDYSEATYSSNFDRTLFLKDEDSIFSDIFLIAESSNKIDIIGLNNKYKSEPNFDLNIPEQINDKNVVSVNKLNNLTNIKDVVLPSTVKTIKEGCFRNNSMKSINLKSSNVESIHYAAFDGCRNLEKIELPATCNSLGGLAFRYCNNATIIDLSLLSIEKIGPQCFSECYKVTEIKLPNTIKSIEYGAFSKCHELTKIDLSSTQIEKIATYGFSECKKATEIKLPNSLKHLEGYAFSECSEVTSLNLEDTQVEDIGYACFHNCKKIPYIKLPNTCKSIGKVAFRYCESTTYIDLSATSLDTISEYCFGKCIKAENILFPNTIKKIDNGAFTECNMVKKLDFSSSILESVGIHSFNNCYMMNELKFPNTLKHLGNAAFDNCKVLTNLNLEDTQVEDIGYACFYGCEKLPYIKLPNTCKTLGKKAFDSCREATYIDLSLTNIEDIADYAFNDCKKITNLKLPNNVKTIGRSSFYNCSKLKELTIPLSLTSIDSYAFTASSELTKIIYKGDKIQFNNINKAPNWYQHINTINPIIEFNDGSSCHYNDL
ncbi:MAG: leucine-rich repeat protein [Candidatus Onthovivens sp.]